MLFSANSLQPVQRTEESWLPWLKAESDKLTSQKPKRTWIDRTWILVGTLVAFVALLVYLKVLGAKWKTKLKRARNIPEYANF